MTCEIRGIPIYYEQYGEGKSILFIHGWSVDHRLMSGCFEPVFDKLHGYCRIYLDLPGMGKTPSADWIKSGDDTHKILLEFINIIIGGKNFLLAGESYGGYLSLGLVYELGNKIDGVFFLCPHFNSLANSDKQHKLPNRDIIYCAESLKSKENDSDIKAFLNMAVIATDEIFEKYKSDILSGFTMHDRGFLEKNYRGEYNPNFENGLKAINYNKPSCFLTGRQDHCVGYSIAYEVLERFSRATFTVLDCAGHNLQIDNEQTFAQLVRDWIWRVELENNNY